MTESGVFCHLNTGGLELVLDNNQAVSDIGVFFLKYYTHGRFFKPQRQVHSLDYFI